MKKVFAAVFVFIALGQACLAESFTYVDLVKKLTDLEGLSVLPQPGEKCMQWSSYDRASKYDEATGKYLNWDANGDSNGYIRDEDGKQVLAEMNGPGCIWRIWSARPQKGHIRIYLDGSSTPVVDKPFDELFDRRESYPMGLQHITGRGGNSYVPIPFRKSCKITADKDWGQYYHFTYSLFPEGTVVPTFTGDFTPAQAAALDAMDEWWSRCLGTDPVGPRQGQVTTEKKFKVMPGKTAAVSLDGTQAITSLKIRLDTTSIRDIKAALREVVIQIKWDGEKTPSVWSPVGDFFGTGPGLNFLKSMTCGIVRDPWSPDTKAVFYSYWYMPFEKGAVVELVNQGKNAFPCEVSVTQAPLTRPVDQLGRFHAKWHRDAFLNTDPDRVIDWPMLRTGQGQLCGALLNVWNPRCGWWGEGDEKFFVDGEKFPSTFGTGSEDYFGYAWGSPILYDNAVHCHSREDNSFISLNRWQVADNVPFQKSFRGRHRE